MIDAAVKALTQMFSPPFRAVLLKSIGLALLMIVLIGIGVYQLLAWLAGMAQTWAEGAWGATFHTPLLILAWIFSIAAGLGIIVGSIFLMPAVAALVGTFFVDDVAAEVERTHYPQEPLGIALPLWLSLTQGLKTALLAVLVYLITVPFLLIAGFGVVIFFLATAFLLGREYFLLAAMRYRPPAEAQQLRRMHRTTVFAAGMLIAAFVSIPIINLAAPLFATALMVHMHKRLSGGRRTAAT